MRVNRYAKMKKDLPNYEPFNKIQLFALSEKYNLDIRLIRMAALKYSMK